MPISNEEKEVVLTHRNKPVVGLIHKKEKTIVFAPCIPEKVSLRLDEHGKAISGTLVNDDSASESDLPIDEKHLRNINALLEEGHVPRYAYTWSSPESVKSSHQLLFRQKCQSTIESNWGGFTLELGDSGGLEYTFVSGAFNTAPGKGRQKGAELASPLIDDVLEETSVLGKLKPQISSKRPPIFETPTKKRQRLLGKNTHTLFSSTLGLAEQAKEEEVEEFQEEKKVSSFEQKR